MAVLGVSSRFRISPGRALGLFIVPLIALSGCRQAARETIVAVPQPGTRAVEPPASAAEIMNAQHVSADTLYTVYSQNLDVGRGNRDQRFLNRLLMVTGVFEGVSRALPGRTYLELRTPDAGAFVYATVASEAAPLLSSVQVGEALRLLCWGDGMTIGSPLLRDCRME